MLHKDFTAMRYRYRAEEVRAIADSLLLRRETRDTLYAVAAEYERMADAMDRAAGTRTIQ